MIEFYYHPTPNGHKVAIFLEESGLPYEMHNIDVTIGEQFSRDFLLISPNNKMPAIVDRDPVDGGDPISIFESGAILLYLADKTKKFISAEHRKRQEAIQWLFWHAAGLGPMSGQLGHFDHSAPEKIPYAIDRYLRETRRLFAVLDRRLQNRQFIIDEYSIVDHACYPWIRGHGHLGIPLDDFPNLVRWSASLGERPAVRRAMDLLKDQEPGRHTVITPEMRQTLWQQSDETVRKAWADAGL